MRRPSSYVVLVYSFTICGSILATLVTLFALGSPPFGGG